MSILAKIENSDSRNLPKPGFTRGFIKAYCKVLKMSPDFILSEYEKTLVDSEQLKTQGVLSEESNPGGLFVLDILKERFLPVFVFVSVISAVYILYSFLGTYENSHNLQFIEQNKTAEQIENAKPEKFEVVETRVETEEAAKVEESKEEDKEVVEVESKEVEAVVATAETEVVLEVEYVPPTGKHILVVEPLVKTALYIKTNLDTKPIKATLKPDVVRKFKFDQAEIRFLDAGSVSLTLDEEYIGALGAFGEEKKIDFPSLKEL